MPATDDTPPEGEWINTLTRAAETTTRVAEALAYAARDLARIFGETPLVKRLCAYSVDLDGAARGIREASGAAHAEYVQQVGQSSRNMLAACIAGVSAGRPDLPPDTVELLRRLADNA